MNVNFKKIPTSTIQEFAEKHGLTMRIIERDFIDLPKYCAYLEELEIKDGCILTSVAGNGNTPEEAMQDYGSKISRQYIVINAMLSSRREMFVPRIVGDPPQLQENQS